MTDEELAERIEHLRWARRRGLLMIIPLVAVFTFAWVSFSTAFPITGDSPLQDWIARTLIQGTLSGGIGYCYGQWLHWYLRRAATR